VTFQESPRPPTAENGNATDLAEERSIGVNTGPDTAEAGISGTGGNAGTADKKYTKPEGSSNNAATATVATIAVDVAEAPKHSPSIGV
jgi:hypothetical protein